MKKYSIILLISVLFSSCWFDTNYGNYEVRKDTFLYQDMNTMCKLLPQEINNTFKEWHWTSKKLEQKYNYYLDNENYHFFLDEELYETLMETDYEFIVKTGYSNEKITYLNKQNNECKVKKNYFLIIRRNKETVLFFET